MHFRKALALNPMLWEAFEGLCSAGSSSCSFIHSLYIYIWRVGQFPEIEDIFPLNSSAEYRSHAQAASSSSHILRQPSTQITSGLFTSDVHEAQAIPQSFRMAGFRDSL